MSTKLNDIKQNRGERLSGLLTFVILAVFMAIILLVVAAGTKNYVNIEERGEDAYGMRTPLAYIEGKIRGAESISVEDDVLTIYNSYGDIGYNTYIYYRGDFVCEYFGNAENPFDPTLGEPVVEARGLTMTAEESLIYVEVTNNKGRTSGMHVLAQGGE